MKRGQIFPNKFLKMAYKPERIPKRKVDTETPSLLKFFKRSEDATPKTIVQHILTQILNSIVDSSELSSKKHSGDSFSEKTTDGWKSQFQWVQIADEGKKWVNVELFCFRKKFFNVVFQEIGNTEKFWG